MQNSAQEVALANLARRQQGMFVLEDAERCGIEGHEVRRRLRRGLLTEPQPGVFASPLRPFSPEAASRAALLCAGPRAVLSHTSAAALWNLGVSMPSRPWITLPFGRAFPAVHGVDVVRSRHLDEFRRRRSGWPVTSPARTWVDCARAMDERLLEGCLANGMQRGLITPRDVDRVLAVAHHRAGTGLARRILIKFHPEWESLLSAALGRLLEGAGIVLQPGYQLILPDGQLVAVLDFADVVRRVAVEADGWAYHGSQAQQQRDRERDRMLLRLGWRTVRFTSTDIGEHPGQLIDDLRAVLQTPPG
ncbi:MAG TPA: type IV toxin-antitoxin system AbiEi family antitoxin domain-containing protein [Mycobacteriales bacterium]|nr:type IV toxin-antitoxin system AbiEi family antitoxin domain-containing protein [Mycobacteriales bacterium]